jgi:hypothetical protein
LSANGTAAGLASWHGDSDRVILVDVGGTLDDAHADECAHVEGSLLWGSNITLGTWYLLGDDGLGSGGESTGSGGVNNGGVWASTICGNDVDGSGERSTLSALRKGGARCSLDVLVSMNGINLCQIDDAYHNGSHVSEGVRSSLGLSEPISGSVLAVEDSGVDLGLLVGSGTWDDTTLDTETSGVSTGITSLDQLVSRALHDIPK